MQNEVTGKPQAAADEQFTHMVVDKPTGNELKLGKLVYGGNAYSIGTLRECREWQLKSGKRAMTEIIPF